MKKARVLLAAIGLFAVIGGTVAFRAQYGSVGTLFCTFIYGSRPTPIRAYVTTTIGVARYCTTTSTGLGYNYTIVTISG